MLKQTNMEKQRERYNWKSFEIGETRVIKSSFRKVSPAAYMYAKKHNVKFVCNKMTIDGVECVSIKRES